MQAKLTGFRTTEIRKCKIIGKSLRCKIIPGKENPIPAFWDKCFSDGTIDHLEKLPKRLYPKAIIGWCGDYNPKDHYFTYLIGVFVESVSDVPDGLTAIDLPTSKYAVATIEGQEPDVFALAHGLTFQKIEEKGLEYDPERDCEFEWYDDRFCQDEDKKVIDLYVPVK